MPVPSTISDLSTTPANNSPAGTETPSTADDYLRTLSAFIAQLDDADAAHVAAVDPHAQYQLKSGMSAYAPKASPALTDVPTAPTAAAGTNTTQLATTAFVQGEKPATASQAEMEAGTEAGIRRMSPLRVAQAIAAKATGGQVFTASGTFTVPSGVTAIKVRGCGGGAGSGISSGSGGTTSFGAYCSATGGGGNGSAGTGSTAGTGTGGDINLSGGRGGDAGASGTYASGGAVGGGNGAGAATSQYNNAAPTGLLGGRGGLSNAIGPTGYGNSAGSTGGVASGQGVYAGGYFEKYITGLTPGGSVTVTIGGGGASGTGGSAGAPGICIVEW